MQQIPTLIVAFRRNISSELELRFRGITLETFKLVEGSLKAVSEPPTITQMVSAITKKNNIQNIREIYFKNGVKEGKEKYVQKEPLMLPVKMDSYIVALSAESEIKQKVICDNDSILRVKNRKSFIIKVGEFNWRIDMTISRQLTGNDSSLLKTVIATIFSPDFVPTSIYNFEIEAEFVEEEKRDMIRPIDITAVAEVVLKHAGVSTVKQTIIKKCASVLGLQDKQTTLKRLLPQVVTLSNNSYKKIYPPRGYYLTDKTDGYRALAFADETGTFIVTDTEVISLPATTKQCTILDGEYVAANNIFNVFDAIMIDGENISSDKFEARLERFDEGAAILRSLGLNIVVKRFHRMLCSEMRPEMRPESKTESKTESKDTGHVTTTSTTTINAVNTTTAAMHANMMAEIRSVYEADYKYKIDGLIFIEPGKSYDSTNTYKWKPPSENSIDFLVKKAPPSVIGKLPYVHEPGHKLHFLFVAINRELQKALGIRNCMGYEDIFGPIVGERYPLQFSPSINPFAYLYQHPENAPEIDGKVVEMVRKEHTWHMLRIREDRSSDPTAFGNDMRIAELIFQNYYDPFPLENLWSPKSSYFTAEKSDAYKAQTAMISFVKEKTIKNLLEHAKQVVDIGSGRGQDLGRYLSADVKTLVAIDNDDSALSELITRKYQFAMGKTPARTLIHVISTDVNAPYAENVVKVKQLVSDVDAVVCNLAVHYYIASIDSMRNFILLTRELVKVGGYVILTHMIGAEVHKKLAGLAVDETWDLYESQVKKYSLKKLFASAKLEAAGQRIGVFLPFSDGTYYEEALVNVDVLTKEFVARGFERVSFNKVTDYLDEFRVRWKGIARSLSNEDREYLSLFGETIFRRVK